MYKIIVDIFRDYPIRHILVPHVGQAPLVAAFPFFKVTFCGFLISFLVRHLKQYACIKSLLFNPIAEIHFPTLQQGCQYWR